jgi:predicted ester cyclase
VLTSSRVAFPDQRYEVEDRIDGRDRVVLRLRWSGTHTGDWQSSFGLFPATGRRFALSVLELYELDQSQIAGAWVAFDIRELLRQLGIELVPSDRARAGGALEAG